MLSGSSRERLVASEAVYGHAFETRQGVRAVRRAALSDGAFCMSFALGLDGRELLPPFVPMGRNSDGVFGHVMRRGFRNSYFGYANEVVAHRPPARSSSMEAMIERLRMIDVNDLVCRVVAASGIETRVLEPRHGLDVIGAHLERLGALPLEELEELVRRLVLRTRSGDLVSLRSTLAQHHRRPARWAEDVARLVEFLSEIVLEPSHSHPRDLVAIFGEDEGRAGLGRVLRDYGRLLGAWAVLDATARELHADGVRPSRPLP
jgi:hypothetical protein